MASNYSVTDYESSIPMFTSVFAPVVLPVFVYFLYIVLICCKCTRRTILGPRFTILLAKALKQLGMGEFEFEKEHQAKEQNDTEEGNRNNRYVREDSTTVQDQESTDETEEGNRNNRYVREDSTTVQDQELTDDTEEGNRNNRYVREDSARVQNQELTEETELPAQGNDALDNVNIKIYGVRVPHNKAMAIILQLTMLTSITILIYNMVLLFVYYAIFTKINASLACISGLDNCFWTNINATTGQIIKINCSAYKNESDIASEDVLCLGSVNILRGLIALAGLVTLMKTANSIYILLAVKGVSKVALCLFQYAEKTTAEKITLIYKFSYLIYILHFFLLCSVSVALVMFGVFETALNTQIEWQAVFSTLFGVCIVPWYSLHFYEYIHVKYLKPKTDMNQRQQYNAIARN